MAGGERLRQARIDELRALVQSVVSREAGHRPASSPATGPGWSSSACPFFPPGPVAPAAGEGRWGLGLSAIDGVLPGGGLDTDGLHELKPASHADGPAAAAFALALLGRLRPGRQRPLLWVVGAAMLHEIGRPYGPGLSGLGLDPSALLLVEPARTCDALWALEEGLRSGALAAAAGLADVPGETAARRLALAARSARTPCVLVTGHARPGLQVARTRWRIAAQASASHPFLAEAPGGARFGLSLERCRDGPGDRRWSVELCDATRAFRMAPRLADRPDAPRREDARAR